MPRKLHGIDFTQTTDPDLLFRDVSLYTRRLFAGAGARGLSSGHRRRLCGTRRRPSDASADVVGAKADGDLGSIATLKPPPELAATEAEIDAIARRHRGGAKGLILCGAGCHGAADELRALSDRLKAPLIHSLKGKDIMPFDDPCWMGGIGIVGTKPSTAR